jgi:murein hydrolase activator
MGNMRDLIFSGVALAAIGFSMSAFAGADVKADLAAKQAQTAELQKKSKELEGEVDTLKARLVATGKTLRDTEDKISDTTERLKALQAEKALCLKSLYADYAALGGLVAAAKKYNRASTPDLLMQANPIDAARASLAMKSMIPRLHKQSGKLRERIGAMARLEEEIAAELTARARQYDTLGMQQADLGRLLEDRKSIYQKTEKSRQEQDAELARLAKEARNLGELVDKIKPKAKSKLTASSLPANLPLPVSGAVETGFGDTDDDGIKSQGLILRTPAGAMVVTPLAGTVKFAGNFQKYKQILIVEHAGGYHSLIAGLGHIDTVVGAALAAGEPVGTAENAEGARIYYELRQGGAPVNPRRLLLAQKKQAKS